jgi:hypothetical protein
MLKKTITFEDLDGNLITEDFYFHMSKAELVEWQLGREGGMEEHLREILANKNTSLILSTFKQILLKSYGVRSADNRSFVKSEQTTREFEGTDAFSQIYIELVSSAQAGVEFINGIMPKDISDKIKDAKASIEVDLPLQSVQGPTFKMPETPVSTSPLGLPKDPSAMSREELIAEFQKKNYLRSGD